MTKLLRLTVAAAMLCASAFAASPLGPTLPVRGVIGGISIPNTFTNLVITNSIDLSSTNTLASQPQLIVPGYDYGLELDVTGGGIAGKASATSSTVYALVNVNSDGTGTNWPTVIPIIASWTLSGTATHLVVFTNFPAVYFSSGSYIQLQAVGTTDTNALTVAHARLTRGKKPL